MHYRIGYLLGSIAGALAGGLIGGAVGSAAVRGGGGSTVGMNGGRGTKQGGKLTEPSLPRKTIVEQDGVKIEHYSRSGDHPPGHAHMCPGKGPKRESGQMASHSRVIQS